MTIEKMACVVCGAVGYMQDGEVCKVCKGKGYTTEPNAPRKRDEKMCEDEFEKELIKALEKTNTKCHENFNLAKGLRGSTNNPSCNFYMGAYAILGEVIDAIKTRKTTTLEQWGK